MTRVLIVNAVPVNNGDAALVLALYDAFKNNGFEVKIATHYLDHANQAYSHVEFVRDVLDLPLIRYTRALKYVLIPIAILSNKNYLESDLIVGAPGGYINSYYSFSHKLFVKLVCKLLGKKTAIYSQSVGPLNDRHSSHLSFFLRFIDILYARDQISYDLLISLGSQDKIFKTEDAAFLLEPAFRQNNEKKNRVAISVRDWRHDSRDLEKYYSLVAALTVHCIEEGYRVDFLSTCQGVTDYTDDSQVAQKIVEDFLNEYRQSITVLTHQYDLESLRRKLKDYDFVIGTRLHMCILSMLSGIPAFNISYEVKGKQCYSYLGIPDFSVDYNESEVKALNAFAKFLDNLPAVENCIRKRITISHEDAQDDFQRFISLIK